jgi:hypothetical protein
MLTECLQYSVTAPVKDERQSAEIRQQLSLSYCKTLEEKERLAHEQIRSLFKHNIFKYQLPPQSILNEDLFSEKTWNLLGLTPKQVTIAGAVGGAVIGAKLDILTAGLSFGVFTGLGGAAGALGAMLGGRKLSSVSKFLGLQLGGEEIRIGPAASINLLLILINRALLFYRHTINWAHGRRDYKTSLPEPATITGFTGKWPVSHLHICKSYFSAVTGKQDIAMQESSKKLAGILTEALAEISKHE